MSTSGNSGGVGITGLLTVAFVVLRLTDTVDWSWWWVLSPLWIGFGLGCAIAVVLAIAGAVLR